MAQVLADFTMSLDGFVAGPDVGVECPMGNNGDRLHDWMFNDERTTEDAQAAHDMRASTGAVILGRRTFDVGIGPWDGDVPLPVPCFVLTHRPLPPLAAASGSFTFVDEGIEHALHLATQAANGGYVRLMGADTACQFLRAGLVDIVQVQIAPLLLGAGTRLFDRVGPGLVKLERTCVIDSPLATHLHYRVAGKQQP